MADADVCVHLASAVGVQMIVNEPLDTLMRSVRGSNVIMHAASRHDVRVLFSSTSEVYGKHTNGALTEQDDLIFGSPSKGRWTYAIAKTLRRGADPRLPRPARRRRAVVRLFNTVGPRQTGHTEWCCRASSSGPAGRGSVRLRDRRADALLHPRPRHGGRR